MAGYEINARIRFVFWFRGVIENDVWSFLQVFLKMRIIDLANHDRWRSLEPNHLLEFATSQHAIEHAFDVADRSGQCHSLADEKIDGQVIEIRMTRPRVYAHVLERDAGELNRLAHAKPARLRLFREVQFLPIVAEQLADGDVRRDRIGGRENAAHPMRLIRDWTIAFSRDECVNNTERWSRHGHDVHEATNHVEIAVVVIPPFL